MSTLLLDIVYWDLLVDASGNIAVATAPYALAQDAASAIKLFRGEQWYDTNIGVRYSQILGKAPPIALMKSEFASAAETVPGVASAKCVITGIVERTVTGQVQVTAENGATAAASF